MNSLTAAELKRRGMAAIEEGLLKGPVHLFKHNKAAAVVLSADDYARLSARGLAQPRGMTALQWLALRAATGSKTKAQIDKELKMDRDDWA
jgi:PHD/YefM family antitoxin component YafN of YafNO toxin-antitoxin module